MSLLNHLWDGAGELYKFVCFKYQDGPFNVESHTDTFTAEKRLQELAAEGYDVWHSCGVFDRGQRKGDYFRGAAALWMDLDVKPDDERAYDTKPEALRELRRFCDHYDIPLPTIVDSGNGIHCYWYLTDAVSPAAWRDAATKLKMAAIAIGMKQDPSRTADTASILRPPGTWNYKDPDNPKPVRMIKEMPPAPISVFAAAFGDVELPTSKPKSTGLNSLFDIAPDYPPSSADLVADSCAQMRAMRASEGNIPEPDWYNGIGVLLHTRGGIPVVHDWSKGHPGYDPAETDRKIEQWKSQGLGPTTCEKFQMTNPAGCEGCPHAGKVTSPIQLGVDPTPVEAPKINGHEAHAPVRNQFGQFRIGDEGVFMVDEDGPQQILDIPMYMERIGRLNYDDAVATVHWKTPKGTWNSSEMSLRVLADRKQLQDWFLRHAITSYKNIGAVQMWLKQFATVLNQDSDPETILQRYGWAGPERFMIGDKEVQADKVATVRVSPKIPSVMQRGIKPVGSLDDWAACTELLDQPEYWPHAFAVLAALAAPVFRIVNVSGAVLSLTGPSGTGKTTSAEFAMSVYGEPSALIQSPQGTLNAKGEFLRIANNVPVTIDEVGNYSNMLGSLIYMAANGRAKERLRQTGELYGQEEWQTLMILTTNSPVMDFPETVIGEAERRRVLELDFDTPMKREDAAKIHAVMQANYGVAIVPFIQAIIRNREQIHSAFESITNKILSDPDVPDANRFGAWLLAASFVAGSLAHAEGIIRFDYANVVQRAVSLLKENASETMDPVAQVDQAVRAWLNEHYGAISIKGEGKQWVREPSRDILAVLHKEEQLLCIPVHRLKTLITDKRIPGTALRKWRNDTNIVIETKNVKLGPHSAAERCVVLKMPVELEGVQSEYSDSDDD